MAGAHTRTRREASGPARPPETLENFDEHSKIYNLDTPDAHGSTGVEASATTSSSKKEAVTKDFVQDSYYEHGHWGLKIRESIITVLVWVFLVFPVLVLINSVSSRVVWSGIYHWEYVDGLYLSSFLQRAIGIIFVVVLGFSVYLLLRNNHREKHVYPQKKTYDEEALARRKEVLEQMYSERFGDDGLRHSTRYYVVAPEQNLPTHLISDLLKKG